MHRPNAHLRPAYRLPVPFFGKGVIIICRFLRLRSDKTKPLLLAISLSAVAGALFSGWDLNCSPAALISSGVIALTTKAENLCTILLP